MFIIRTQTVSIIVKGVSGQVSDLKNLLLSNTFHAVSLTFISNICEKISTGQFKALNLLKSMRTHLPQARTIFFCVSKFITGRKELYAMKT